jgi:tetratricopeptide (TPR) repeat protein
MKTSTVRENHSRKNVILKGFVAILAILCITLNSIPLTAEGADEALDDQPHKGLTVNFELELTSIKQVLSDLALVHVKIANAYADHKNFSEAIPWANMAVRLDPASLEANLILGIVSFRIRNTAQAISSFEKIIELDPSNFDAHFYLGRMYSGRDKPSLAVEYLTHAIERAVSSEDLSMAYSYRGLAYSVMQRYEECFSDLDQAQSIDSDNWMVELVRGTAIDSMNKHMNPASDHLGDQGFGRGVSFSP